MNFVLDACALIAYLRKERGGERVRDLLLDPKNSFAIHTLNLCEVYYDFIRVGNESVAEEMLQIVTEIGIRPVDTLDDETWIGAARLKARIKRISLADTFAAELSKQTRATLLTTDHKEFDVLAKEKYCKIEFLR